MTVSFCVSRLLQKIHYATTLSEREGMLCVFRVPVWSKSNFILWSLNKNCSFQSFCVHKQWIQSFHSQNLSSFFDRSSSFRTSNPICISKFYLSLGCLSIVRSSRWYAKLILLKSYFFNKIIQNTHTHRFLWGIEPFI